MWMKTQRCLVRRKDQEHINVLSPSKYKLKYKKEINEEKDSSVYTTYILLWIFYVFVLSCVCYVFVQVCLYVPCGHLMGKG